MSKFYLTVLLLISVCFAEAQTASFTYQSVSGVYCSPTEIRFHASSSIPAVGFKWDFGDGQTSTLSDPYITFNSPGTYTVRLLGVFDNSTSESSQTITINPSVTATLTADRNYLCQPGPINFAVVGNGNFNSFEWDFGDGTTDVTTTATTAHSYSGYGNYTAKVKAIDVGGCFGLGSYAIRVTKAPISGSVSPLLGCTPALVNFSASADLPNNDRVASYSWNFGNGAPVSSTTLGNTSYTYMDTGSYKPTVSITTIEGCTSDFSFPDLAYGIPPVNLTSYARKYQYCGSENVELIAKAPLANSYLWDFGDGQTEKHLDTITQHRYQTLGIKNITVTPMFNGCPGASQKIQVNIVGVISSYNFQNTCSSPRTFTLTNTAQGNQSSILWNFGDGSPTSNTVNPVHTFPPYGSYNVSLAVVDSITGCGDIVYHDIYTASPTMVNADPVICRNTPTVFSLQNNYTNPYATYTWNVLGVSTKVSDPTFTISPTNFGTFPSNAVIIDNGPSYCPDTVSLNRVLTVRGPRAAFTADSNSCVNAAYLIKNTSAPYDPANAITFSSWNYGNTNVVDTTTDPGVIRYPSYGDFLVKLIVKDNVGCIDSVGKIVHVFPTPFLRIFPRTLTLCQGQTDTLIAYHSDSIRWSPAASVSSTNKDTVIARPASSSIIYATAGNIYGCSALDSTITTVYEPFNAVATASKTSVCINTPVTLSVSPSAKKVSWSPPTSVSDSTAFTTSATPTVSTTYSVRLVDSLGCYSSVATVNVIVKSLPTVNAGPDQILPFGAVFTMRPTVSDNVVTYTWTPATSLSCTNCASPTGSAFQSETYTLKVTSDSGCVAQDQVNIFIECKNSNITMPSAFTPNDDGRNDIFYPIAKGVKKVARFAVYDRTGRVMFEAKDFLPNDRTFGWDGRYRGVKQAGGAYVYIMETVCQEDQIIVTKGSIMLLR